MSAGEPIPQALRERPRWLIWRYVQRGQGKPTKQPRRPSAPHLALSIHDTHHLVSCDEARQLVDAGQADGIGYAMRAEDGLVFVDLDGAVQNGQVAPWAQEVVFNLGGYAEYSPTGTGLHVLVRGQLPNGAAGLTNHPQGVECYASGRYFTVTGEHYAGAGLPEAQAGIDWLCGKYFGDRAHQAVADVPELQADDEAPVLSLDELVANGLSADHRRLIEHGDNFDAFYDDDQVDHSRAVWDCCHAMAAAGANAETMLDVLADPSHYLAQNGALARRTDPRSAREWLWRYQVYPALQQHQAALEAEAAALQLQAPTTPGLPPVTVGLDIGDSADGLPPEPWILGQRFRLGAVTLGHGDPGCGKSYLSILSALAILTGQPLTGETVVETGNVWILNNEDSLADIRKRVHAICRFHGLDLDLVRQHLRISSGVDQGRLTLAHLVSAKDPKTGHRAETVDATPDATAMLEFIRANHIRHLVLDPLVQLHALDENNNAHLNRLLGVIGDIAAQGGCSVDLLHHNVKGGEDPESSAGRLYAARGASAITGAVRAQYSVCRMGATSGDLLGIPEQEWPRYVRLQMGKNNYGTTAGGPVWFYLESQALRNAAPPRPADSMAVPVLRPLQAEAELAQALAAGRAEDEAFAAETAILNALAEYLAGNGKVRITAAMPAVSSAVGHKVTADQVRQILQHRKDARLGADLVEIRHEWSTKAANADTVELLHLDGAA